MTVSVDTLVLATGLVGFGVALAMAALHGGRSHASGYVYWLIGIALHAAGLVVLGIDQVLPEPWAIATGNVIVALSVLPYVRAMALLHGRRAPMRTLVLLTALVAVATVVFTFVAPSIPLRIGAIGVQFLVAQGVLIGLMAAGLRTEPGRAYRLLFALVVAATAATLTRTVWFALAGDVPNVDGASSVALFVTNLLFFATSGLAYLGVLEDRNRRAVEAATAELARLSRTDALTGLANRGHFDATLRREVERSARHGHPLTLAMLDLDHFKAVNDVHGHVVGDKVLKRSAAALARTSRVHDLAARIGGEEFALILPDTDATGGHALAERARIAIAHAPGVTGLGEVAVTVSAGVAQLAPGEDAERLYARADAALYAAKRGGRDRTVAAAA
jgi:diguanylate cyclase (GGDEF)-like protein